MSEQTQTLDLNHNTAQCIRDASKLGETIYYNICNGSTTHVPWGGFDWILAGFGILSIIVLLGIGCGIAYMLFTALSD